MIKKIFGIVPIVFMSVFATGCTEEEKAAPLYFELASEVLECNSEQPVSVSVPIEGQTYRLSVKASAETEWNASLEGDDWVVVSPTTKQTGDGEISIIASPNTGNVQDRTANVSITNTANEKVYSYVLTQMFDPEKLVQREESFVFVHYEDEQYNQDMTYTTYLNKIDGDIKLSVLGQAELDAYNNDNATNYQLLSPEYFEPIPTSVTFGDEDTMPLVVTFKKDMSALDDSQEYVLPICVSANDKERLKIWIVVKISKQSLPIKEQEFTFYNAGENMTCKVSVERMEGEVTLTAFDEDRVTDLGTEYRLIPSKYIDIPASVSFEEGEQTTDVNVTFKSSIKEIELEQGKQYVCGFCINTDGRPSSEVLIMADIITPVLSMECSDQQIDMSEEEAVTTKSFDFEFKLDVENQWNFDVNLETDEEKLKAAVTEYGGGYTLLPSNNINFTDMKFESGTNEITVTATIDRNGLTVETQYLYPIIPTGCGDKPFEVEDKISYVKVYVAQRIPGANELSEISLTSQMLTASSTCGSEYGVDKLVDNIYRIGDGVPGDWKSYWESVWATNTDPLYDAKYGIYIDINLGENAPKNFIAFNYVTRSEVTSLPANFEIYAGEDSGSLIKIGELKRDEDNLPTVKSVWYKDPATSLNELPVFPLKGTSAKLVRIAIKSSSNNGTVNNLTDPDYINTVGNQPCVAMAEIKLYGDTY